MTAFYLEEGNQILYSKDMAEWWIAIEVITNSYKVNSFILNWKMSLFCELVSYAKHDLFLLLYLGYGNLQIFLTGK